MFNFFVRDVLRALLLIVLVTPLIGASILPGSASALSDFEDLKEDTQKELESVDDETSAKVKANLEAAIEILETAHGSGGVGRTRKALTTSVNSLELLVRRVGFLSPKKIRNINEAFQLAEDRLRAYLVKHGQL